MAETKLCPLCKTIMTPCKYIVEKKDGTRDSENRIISKDGVCILGKLVYCNKCGIVAVVR